MKQPLAYVHPAAKIAPSVVIDPFVTIDQNVEIGEGLPTTVLPLAAVPRLTVTNSRMVVLSPMIAVVSSRAAGWRGAGRQLCRNRWRCSCASVLSYRSSCDASGRRFGQQGYTSVCKGRS